MKKLKRNFLSSFPLRETKCKFTHLCNFYSNSSYTYTHLGGTYCGKYRALSKTGKNIIVAEMGENLTERSLIQ